MDIKLENNQKSKETVEERKIMESDEKEENARQKIIQKTENIIFSIKNLENEEDRPLKRKRVVLTMEDKKNVIAERDKGKLKLLTGSYLTRC
jgi:hypothetical protein